jgi:putative YpdA family bacillithiol system oxidoreductase
MSSQRFDLVIIGAGPAGLSAAARAQANGMDYVLLERTDHLADTVFRYLRGKPVMAEPSAIPLRSDIPFEAGHREEVLEAWERAARQRELHIRHGCEVTALECGDAGFRLTTSTGGISARRVVLAMGTQGNPRRLGIPGEDLPHVSHHLQDPAEHRDEVLAVVGAGDSALEVALALSDNNRVHLVVRKPEIQRAKESLEREVLQRQARGELEIHFSTTVAAIERDAVRLQGPGGELRVPCRRVFLMIGADPPRRFLESVGVAFTGPGREAKPVLDSSYQSSVPGLYLIGALTGRDLIKPGINQGWEVAEHLAGREVEPADEGVLAGRLPFWSGPVRDRIAAITRRLPLLAEASEPDLREVFLSAEVRQWADGEVILRQNDYTDSFLAIVDGRVAVSVRPEGADRDLPVATLETGDFFGEMSLLSGRRRNATVTAVSGARLVEIPRRAMLKLLAISPEVKRRVDQTFLVRAFQSYLFPDLPTEVLEELVARSTVEVFDRSHTLFSEGDEGDAFYLIRSGMVKVTQRSGDEERVLSYFTAGNYFGETALIAGTRRTATVSTIFPSELIRLDSGEFQSFLQEHPDLRSGLTETLEQRRIAALEAEATPGAGEITSRLIDQEITMGTNALLIDEHKCIRCGNCIAACVGVHEDGQARLSLTGRRFYHLLAPNSCWQCEDPKCMLDCPPDALVRDARGEIHIRSNCIGCGNCEENCPYGNIFMVHPREGAGPFGWLKGLLGMKPPELEREVAVKCDMIHVDGGPACVRACPTGAAFRVERHEYEEALAEIVVLRGGA